VLAANLNAARTVSWPARFGIEELHEFPGESSAGEDLGGPRPKGAGTVVDVQRQLLFGAAVPRHYSTYLVLGLNLLGIAMTLYA